jgi:hypothetical protein
VEVLKEEMQVKLPGKTMISGQRLAIQTMTQSLTKLYDKAPSRLRTELTRVEFQEEEGGAETTTTTIAARTTTTTTRRGATLAPSCGVARNLS